MVGAVILFVLALVSGIVGVWVWGKGIGTDDPGMLTRGIFIMAISVVSLTGALIIDGVRYYANKVTQQLEWIVRRSGGVPNGGSGTIESSNPLGTVQLSKYHIVGKNRETGAKTELVVQAVDQMAAYRTGEKAGIDVTQVEIVSDSVDIS